MVLFKLGILTESQYKWWNVVKCDVTRRLLFEYQTVIKIFTSHFIEHIPIKNAIKFLKECCRVLKPNGTIRIVVPDLLGHAENYVNKNKILLGKSPYSQNRIIHDSF